MGLSANFENCTYNRPKLHFAWPRAITGLLPCNLFFFKLHSNPCGYLYLLLVLVIKWVEDMMAVKSPSLTSLFPTYQCHNNFSSTEILICLESPRLHKQKLATPSLFHCSLKLFVRMCNLQDKAKSNFSKIRSKLSYCYSLSTLSWRSRKTDKIGIHLTENGSNQRHVIFDGR